jgi:hypothetical protein
MILMRRARRRRHNASEDIAEAVRFDLRLAPACVVPEIIFQRPGETLWAPRSPKRSSSCCNSSAAGASA